MPAPAPTLRLPVLNDDDTLAVAPPAAAGLDSPYAPSYWRSLEAKYATDGAEHSTAEFSPGAAEMDSLGRRDFVKLLGASMGLAGVGLGSACGQAPATEHSLPYHQNPDGLTVGNPLHYATCLTIAGVASPLLVTAREGRPVKVEGNPDHPVSLGASSAIEQASILSLYDPQRARLVKRRGQPVAKKTLLEAIAHLVTTVSARDGGKGVRFLVEPSSSPWLAQLRGRVLEKMPNARFISMSALSSDHRHEGATLAFGRPLEPRYDFSKAAVIVTLDADPLDPTGNQAASHQWALGRQRGTDMSRHYAVGPEMTVTASVADHRLRLKGSAIDGFARALLSHIQADANADNTVNAPTQSPLPLTAQQQRVLDAMAADLREAGPRGVVVVGERQSPAVHAVAHAINAQLGAIGHTVTLVKPVVDDIASGPQALKTLTQEINAGDIDALVITASNPAYARFADIDFAAALAQLSSQAEASPPERPKLVVSSSLYEDETSALSQWFVPAQHPFESWGDGKALDGSVLFQQPLLVPLHSGSVSEAQLYAAFLGEAERSQRLALYESWRRRDGAAADFDARWASWLQQGFVPGSAHPAENVSLDRAAIERVTPTKPIEGFELALRTDVKLLDGRYSTTTWLLELPDPMTKLVWDNAALVSPATAQKLRLTGVNTGVATWRRDAPVVALTVGGKTVKAPVYVLPGCADDVITLPLGWGNRGVGVDAYALQHASFGAFAPVHVEPLDETYQLVSTQEHWSMNGRDDEIAIERPVTQLPEVQHSLRALNGLPAALQQPVDYSKVQYKWGMAIDLSVCTGCSACITACQAENNIPVVGKRGVSKNREMFWIRVDRYFIGDENEPGVITQPIACQHCETAPCEYVCPVNATSHSDEGLNDMVYNRCIGTRYCSNNCPYKVRRFNYFHYNRELTPVERLAKNPDVTVRARGVMEKCTFCVQRIERARIEQRRAGQAIADGLVKTACQQACPTGAIAFGNLNEPDSEVARRHADPRRYELLHDLGTRPRNVFLARLKNPHPSLVEPSAAGEHS